MTVRISPSIIKKYEVHTKWQTKMTLEERVNAPFLEAPDNNSPGPCPCRNDNLMPELCQMQQPREKTSHQQQDGSRMRTRTKSNSISMRTCLKSLTRLEQVYPLPLLPRHPLPDRVRGEEKRHDGAIARSEIRRAASVRTGCNSILRRSVNDDRRTDNTALTLMCVKVAGRDWGRGWACRTSRDCTSK